MKTQTIFGRNGEEKTYGVGVSADDTKDQQTGCNAEEPSQFITAQRAGGLLMSVLDDYSRFTVLDITHKKTGNILNVKVSLKFNLLGGIKFDVCFKDTFVLDKFSIFGKSDSNFMIDFVNGEFMCSRLKSKNGNLDYDVSLDDTMADDGPFKISIISNKDSTITLSFQGSSESGVKPKVDGVVSKIYNEFAGMISKIVVPPNRVAGTAYEGLTTLNYFGDLNLWITKLNIQIISASSVVPNENRIFSVSFDSAMGTPILPPLLGNSFHNNVTNNSFRFWKGNYAVFLYVEGSNQPTNYTIEIPYGRLRGIEFQNYMTLAISPLFTHTGEATEFYFIVTYEGLPANPVIIGGFDNLDNFDGSLAPLAPTTVSGQPGGPVFVATNGSDAFSASISNIPLPVLVDQEPGSATRVIIEDVESTSLPLWVSNVRPVAPVLESGIAFLEEYGAFGATNSVLAYLKEGAYMSTFDNTTIFLGHSLVETINRLHLLFGKPDFFLGICGYDLFLQLSQNKRMHSLNGNPIDSTPTCGVNIEEKMKNGGSFVHGTGRLEVFTKIDERSTATRVVEETEDPIEDHCPNADVLFEMWSKKAQTYNPFMWLLYTEGSSGIDGEVEAINEADLVVTVSLNESKTRKSKERNESGSSGGGQLGGGPKQKMQDSVDLISRRRSLDSFDKIVREVAKDKSQFLAWLLDKECSWLTVLTGLRRNNIQWYMSVLHKLQKMRNEPANWIDGVFSPSKYDDLVVTLAISLVTQDKRSASLAFLLHSVSPLSGLAHMIDGYNLSSFIFNEEFKYKLNEVVSLICSFDGGWSEVQRERHNRLMHSLNGNTSYESVLKSKHNKMMHALNGNTSNFESEESVVGKLVEDYAPVRKTRSMMELPMTLIDLNDEHLPEPSYQALFNRMRGFSAIMSGANRNITLSGDLFSSEMSWTGNLVSTNLSHIARENFGFFHSIHYTNEPPVAPFVSTEKLRVTTIGSIMSPSSARHYNISQEAANLMVVSARVRTDAITIGGFFATDVTVLANLGPDYSDDYTCWLMKLYQLAYILAPNQDPVNSVPWRGPLEALDTNFHVDPDTRRTTITEFPVGTDDPSQRLSCMTSDGLRFIPFAGEEFVYNPKVAFHVTVQTIPDASRTNFIAINSVFLKRDINTNELFVRLHAIMVLPAPIRIWLWRVALKYPDIAAAFCTLIPNSNLVSFDGFSDEVLHILLPVGAVTRSPPTSQTTANQMPMFVPSIGGRYVNINYIGSPGIIIYDALVWIDEYINDITAPSRVIEFINILTALVGCNENRKSARSYWKQLAVRGQPLLIAPLDVGRVPLTRNVIGQGNPPTCDSTGSAILQTVSAILPSVTGSIDYRLTTVMPVMFTMVAMGVYVPTYDDGSFTKDKWLTVELGLAQMAFRNSLASAQMLFDHLGVSVEGYNNILAISDNAAAADFITSMYAGAAVSSSMNSVGMIGYVLDSLASKYIGCGLPSNGKLCLNLFRTRPLGIVSCEPYSISVTPARYRFAVYSDWWMQFICKPLAEYCQPPPPSRQGIWITAENNFLNNGLAAAPFSELVMPWKQGMPPNLKTDTWFVSPDLEQLMNRRTIIWMSLHGLDNPGFRFESIMTNSTATQPGGIDTEVMCVSTSCGSAFGFSPPPAVRDNKLDCFPKINTTDWYWLTLQARPDVPGVGGTILKNLLSAKTVFTVNYLVPTGRSVEPIFTVPGLEIHNPTIDLFKKGFDRFATGSQSGDSLNY